MKTTVELPDGLIREARRVAQRDKTTLQALIERGLRTVIGPQQHASRFTLRDGSFGGDGLVPGRSLREWATIRDLSYGPRE